MSDFDFPYVGILMSEDSPEALIDLFAAIDSPARAAYVIGTAGDAGAVQARLAGQVALPVERAAAAPMLRPGHITIAPLASSFEAHGQDIEVRPAGAQAGPGSAASFASGLAAAAGSRAIVIDMTGAAGPRLSLPLPPGPAPLALASRLAPLLGAGEAPAQAPASAPAPRAPLAAEGVPARFSDDTCIASLMLDRQLTIRGYTAAATELFELSPAEIGTPLAAIPCRLDAASLVDDARAALDEESVVERRLQSLDGRLHYAMHILPAPAGISASGGVLIAIIDVTCMVHASGQQVVVDELNHRVKNVLTVVSSIAANMAASGGTIEGFLHTFGERLAGLARTHDILSANEWRRVDLRDVITTELFAFAGSERFSLAGPVVALRARAVTTLGIVVHELATNAAKYGALSRETGRISIEWSIFSQGGTDFLRIVWQERGGPRVTPPSRKGFGTGLIERSIEYEVAGEVALEYRQDGLRAVLLMPVNELTGDA